MLVEQGALLIDVREREEYEEAHIPGCILVPMSQLAAKANELDKKKSIILYCQSGGRSARAMHWLRQQGFLDVKNLDGGIVNWIYEKMPIEKGL